MITDEEYKFFMLAQEAIPNGCTKEGYCKASSFANRSFLIEAVFGKPVG